MTEDHQNDPNDEVNLPDADFSALEDESGRPDHGLTKDIEKLRSENEENRDKYLRALAELENFKKRAMKERSDLLKYQGEKVLYDMLSVLDNLELALQHAEADPLKVKEGLELIQKSFLDILRKWDVKPESGLGKDFDPAKHSAISKIRVDDAKPGSVINELKKAYFYKDKLLRPGEVVVAAEHPADEPTESRAEDDEGAAEELSEDESNEE